MANTYPRALTPHQKLSALAHRFYQGAQWQPNAGDYYTTSRADLELYRVAKIEEGKLFTEYCTRPGELTEWDADTFTTEGFGPRRVHVPDFIIEVQAADQPEVVCKGDIRLGIGCKKCSRCKSQMEEYSFTPPELSLQDNLRNTKMQQAIQYATNIIEANKECFIAQWVMQNQDKNIEDYVLCYSYRGEAMKFWLEEKNNV